VGAIIGMTAHRPGGTNDRSAARADVVKAVAAARQFLGRRYGRGELRGGCRQQWSRSVPLLNALGRFCKDRGMNDGFPAGLALRHPEPEDQLRVLDVMDAWWAGFQGETGSLQRRLLLPRLFFQHFADSSYLLERDDGHLGAFLIGFLSQSQPQVGYIHFVGVDPTFRRAGLGARLYNQFFRYAASHGCTAVRCITSPSNTTSVAFHAGLGFAVDPSDTMIDGIAIQRDYDGRGLDRVTFTRSIDADGLLTSGQRR
jgi:GNAT superfamily N-acetyltransferase